MYFSMYGKMLISRLTNAITTAPTVQGAYGVCHALGVIGLCSGCTIGMGWSDRFMQIDNIPKVEDVSKQFIRSLFFPAIAEEVFWRIILLQPPNIKLTHIILVNVAFTIYHIVLSGPVSEKFDNKAGAIAVFNDPTFLFLAFILGNACTYSYIRADYALWAPVLTHAIPVTVWLSCLNGEKALQTPGGLPKKPKKKLKMKNDK